jgi:putative FmdB family regulatory protein
MPIYTYRCESCGVQFEEHQHFDDPPLTVCPECGEQSLRKLYLPVGIVFKGSGFYATDHRSPSGMSSTKKAETPAQSEASETSEAKSTTTASKTSEA